MKLLFKAPLTKLKTQYEAPILYQLDNILLNPLLNRKIAFHFNGEIFCIQCQKKTYQSFQGGFCFPCFKRLQECGLCMIHPERCRHEEGICDPTDWVHASCGEPHIVYLSNTVHIKVGITRKTQMPTRWIDQGAIQAIPLFETKNRYLAGQMEVKLKQFFPDKTPWQAMLKNNVQEEDLIQIREQFFIEQADFLNQPGITALNDSSPTQIVYPVIQYPTTIKTLNLDKTPKVEGTLLGIKGQYLLLDTGVLNIRKFGGYFSEVWSEI